MKKEDIIKFKKTAEVIDYFKLSYYMLGGGNENEFEPKQIDNIKRAYLKLLSFAPERIRLMYQGYIDTWQTRSKARIMRDVYELKKEIEKHNPELKQEPEELIYTINWKKNKEILKRHLQLLKKDNIIYYDNINDVISGDEQASFIKMNKVYSRPTENALSLFKYWNDNEYITNFILKDKWQLKNIIESFSNQGKKFKNLRSERQRYFKRSKFPTYDYFTSILK